MGTMPRSSVAAAKVRSIKRPTSCSCASIHRHKRNQSNHFATRNRMLSTSA